MTELEVKRVGAIEVPLPEYQTAGAAGMDLRAATKDAIILRPLDRKRVPTGLAIAVPPGFEAQVRPRSGLAARFGITVLNSPGTIDSDYRGEIEVMLVNLGDSDFTLAPFERIAQLVIAPVVRAELKVVGELSETVRGAGGYGSTGTK